MAAVWMTLPMAPTMAVTMLEITFTPSWAMSACAIGSAELADVGAKTTPTIAPRMEKGMAMVWVIAYTITPTSRTIPKVRQKYPFVSRHERATAALSDSRSSTMMLGTM